MLRRDLMSYQRYDNLRIRGSSENWSIPRRFFSENPSPPSIISTVWIHSSSPPAEHVITICDRHSLSPFTSHPPHPLAPARPAIAPVAHTSQPLTELFQIKDVSTGWTCRDNVSKNRGFADMFLAKARIGLAYSAKRSSPRIKCTKPVHIFKTCTD